MKTISVVLMVVLVMVLSCGEIFPQGSGEGIGFSRGRAMTMTMVMVLVMVTAMAMLVIVVMAKTPVAMSVVKREFLLLVPVA